MSVDFRYKQLGYVALAVTDISASAAFATDVFGLDSNGEGEAGARYFRAGAGHHDVVLVPAKEAAFVRSSWQLETEEDLDRAYHHYAAIGRSPVWLALDESKAMKLERAFRVTDPVVGATWEYFARMSQVSAPRRNSLTRFEGGKHFGFVVPDCKALAEYMNANMGFITSDHLEGWLVALLRAFPNPNHHSFAPTQFPAKRPAFHHLAFMVAEIDDIGRLFNRIKRFKIDVQFGIGRHPTSGSIHLYIYGPDTFVWEYTLGMEQFPEHGARPARRMSSAPENFDLWGAIPDGSRSADLPMLRLNL